MIKGKLYRVQLNGHTLHIVVPDESGDNLIEFSRLALAEHFAEWDSDADNMAAGAWLGGVERIDNVYIDARVVSDVHH